MAKRKAMSPGMAGDESFQMYGIVYWDEAAAEDAVYNPIFASQTEDLLYAAGYYLARNQQDRTDHCAAMLEQCKVSPPPPAWQR